jgi:hypothetical protein
MSRKLRNLLLGSGLIVAAVFFATSFFFSSGKTTPRRSAMTPIVTPPPTPTPSEPSAQRESVAGSRIYAVSLPRLQGLPANASAGTNLEVWVAWEPPITKAPRFQKLLEGVVLKEIVPPPIPEAPPTALLAVSSDQVADLLYADRFGSLSVLIVPDM